MPAKGSPLPWRANPGGLVAYYRDTTLPASILALYEPGILFREPTFCDATYKFGGLAAPHRYLILSANATCLDPLAENPEWGLCVWPPGRILKVLGVHRKDRFAQVTLLEIPESLRRKFTTERLGAMEEELAGQASEHFATALATGVLPEHESRRWLDRLRYPVGVSDDGRFFESWRGSPAG